MTFSAGLFDELTPCYPDTEAGTGKTEYRTAGANGTYAGVNILLDGLTPGIPVSVEVEGGEYGLQAVPHDPRSGGGEHGSEAENGISEKRQE